jgi:hypothetical protein
MDKRLEKIMKKSLGVTVMEVMHMGDDDLRRLYDKALKNEEVKALEASDTERGETLEAIDSAHIVDWLWERVKKL